MIGHMSTWATLTDVTTLTGLTPTQAILDQAESQIELTTGVLANVILSPGMVLWPRDLEYLRRATAYQAAWLAFQPDAYQRSEVTEIIQDGIRLQPKEGTFTLAPFARRALSRLSWRGTRSISVATQGDKRRRNLNTLDDDLPWGSMDGEFSHTSSQSWREL